MDSSNVRYWNQRWVQQKFVSNDEQIAFLLEMRAYLIRNRSSLSPEQLHDLNGFVHRNWPDFHATQYPGDVEYEAPLTPEQYESLLQARTREKWVSEYERWKEEIRLFHGMYEGIVHGSITDENKVQWLRIFLSYATDTTGNPYLPEVVAQYEPVLWNNAVVRQTLARLDPVYYNNTLGRMTQTNVQNATPPTAGQVERALHNAHVEYQANPQPMIEDVATSSHTVLDNPFGPKIDAVMEGSDRSTGTTEETTDDDDARILDGPLGGVTLSGAFIHPGSMRQRVFRQLRETLIQSDVYRPSNRWRHSDTNLVGPVP